MSGSRLSGLVDHAKTLDCIHCGLCLRTCPTYQLTGSESSSPRGRIALMRALGEGRIEADRAFAEEMDFCLLCRHCESACPAGVRFGEMMESTRDVLEREPRGGRGRRLLRRLGFRAVLPSRAVLATLGLATRLGQRSGLFALTRRLLGRRAAFLDAAPRVPPWRDRRRRPVHTPARGERRGEVVVLEGCVQPVFFGRVNAATVESLSALGYDVHVPRSVVCCGSLHAHNGDLEGARRLADRVLEGFAGGAPIVVNSAGCGAHLAELANLFEADDPRRARAQALSERVVDYAVFVDQAMTERPPSHPVEAGRVAWDDPCHLCHGQGVRREPRAVLDALDGVERVELEEAESCCGSAGIYSVIRPNDSQLVFEPKREAFERSGADTLVTANPGCQLQWTQGLARAGNPARVVHLAELVCEAYRER